MDEIGTIVMLVILFGITGLTVLAADVVPGAQQAARPLVRGTDPALTAWSAEIAAVPARWPTSGAAVTVVCVPDRKDAVTLTTEVAGARDRQWTLSDPRAVPAAASDLGEVARARRGLTSSEWSVVAVVLVGGRLRVECDLAPPIARRAAAVCIRDLVDRTFALSRALSEAFLASIDCPRRCAPLVRRPGGEESACPVCGGRLLASGLAAHALHERGYDALALKDAPARDRPTAVCPWCETRMSPIVVDDATVDLCRGCGALFLDEGELAPSRDLMT